MVEIDDTQRMGLLIGAAAILIFVVVNMTGLLGGGDEKLFIIDLIGIGSMDAMRPDTGEPCMRAVSWHRYVQAQSVN